LGAADWAALDGAAEALDDWQNERHPFDECKNGPRQIRPAGRLSLKFLSRYPMLGPRCPDELAIRSAFPLDSK
jgi:hypothetical protein